MYRRRSIFIITLPILLAAALLSGCGHTHDWTDATCTEPRTCLGCGETEGEPLGHLWREATCTEPVNCSRCGETQGEPLGHVWEEATCTEPKTCSRCGETQGEPLGHDVPELSCTEGGVCTRCGEEIEALGHVWLEATCTEPKTCERCGETEGEPLGHSPADPVTENEREPTCTEEGSYQEAVYCTVCGEELSRTDRTLEPLGHTTRNGVCERCGEDIHDRITGEGDAVEEEIGVGAGLFRVRFTNTTTAGKGVFSVNVKYADKSSDMAVDDYGNYDGWYFLYGTGPYTFEIVSSGKWSYQIERLGTTSDTSFSGTGSYTTDIFTGKSGEWHLRHSDHGAFTVWLYTNRGRDLLVRESGYFDGYIPLTIPTGSSCVLVVEGDGKWSIDTE